MDSVHAGTHRRAQRQTGALSRRRFGVLAAGAVAATAAVSASGDAAAAARVPATASLPVTNGGCAPDPAAPVEQLRGLWIASVLNIDWPSKPGLSAEQQKEELVGWLDLAQQRRLNAVFLQIRPTADAFWPSRYEPWSVYLTGTQGRDPGYDPLAFAIAEAHKRDIELHGWFNPYRVSKDPDPGKLVDWHPARKHPDWIFRYGNELYYNPGIPEVRRFVEDAILDPVSRYDLDGVHFDDYFYPYPIAGQTLPDADTFARYGGGFADIGDWRRNNVNLLVSELNGRIHRAKPWLKWGISPFGIWRNKKDDPNGSDTNGFDAYASIYADTRKWVREGWLDYIAPQVYWYLGFAVADYAKLVPWWSELVKGTHTQLYIGEAVYREGVSDGGWQDPAELTKHLTFDEGYPQVGGHIYFAATDVRANRLGGFGRLVAEHYRHPALTPAMPHLDRRAPRMPVVAGARRTASGIELSIVDTSTPRAASYAVYRFEGAGPRGRCDFADASHLIATVRTTGRVQRFVDPTAAAGRRYTYHVVAASRLSARSRPSVGTVVPA